MTEDDDDDGEDGEGFPMMSQFYCYSCGRLRTYVRRGLIHRVPDEFTFKHSGNACESIGVSVYLSEGSEQVLFVNMYRSGHAQDATESAIALQTEVERCRAQGQKHAVVMAGDFNLWTELFHRDPAGRRTPASLARAMEMAHEEMAADARVGRVLNDGSATKVGRSGTDSVVPSAIDGMWAWDSPDVRFVDWSVGSAIYQSREARGDGKLAWSDHP